MPDVEVIGDKESTVWVNDDTGACIGRFSKRFGIDIHHTAEVVLATGNQCLYCIQGPEATWVMFVLKMKELHDVDVLGLIEHNPIAYHKHLMGEGLTSDE